LVTFIACEIVTGDGLTEILGTHRGRFQPARRHRRGGGASRPAMLPCGNCAKRPDASFAPREALLIRLTNGRAVCSKAARMMLTKIKGRNIQ
jgi:hypothetical protein